MTVTVDEGMWHPPTLLNDVGVMAVVEDTATYYMVLNVWSKVMLWYVLEYRRFSN